MPLAFLTFFSGLAISAVAIYYSVLGLAAIFAAAVVPIIVMGTILEISKLVAAWWLKANWHRAPFLLKSYMLVAVIVLMLITSMGIFGFLSKAHSDQAIPLGDSVSQVAFIDEKINNERETIANARTLIKQLDDAVAGIQSGEGREIRLRDGTTRIQNPAERALQVRRAQAADRAALTKTIEEAQARIVKLQEEKAPIAGQLRAIEAEVGPIKYIAKLIYGDNTEKDMLEKAVVWVIIIIVFVFDPLAVLLLLASQMSFRWAQEERALKLQTAVVQPAYEPDDGPLTDEQIDQIKESVQEPVQEPVQEEKLREDPHAPGWAFTRPLGENISSSVEEKNEVTENIEEEIKEVEDSIDSIVNNEEIFEDATDSEKIAMKAWKHDNPDSSLKFQKNLYKKGLINKLPWENYNTQTVDEDNEAAIEAAKWAEEQLEESKKKDSNLDGNNRGQTSQTNTFGIEGYVQNAEQNDSTIWQRVKKAKDNE